MHVPLVISKLFRLERFHLHKTFALISLLHYVFRFTYPNSPLQNGAFTCFIYLLPHLLLNLTSLNFKVARSKNSIIPIINREFQLHSLCFVIRCCIFIVLSVSEYRRFPLRMWRKQSLAPDIQSQAFRVAVTLSVMIVVDQITIHFGDPQQKTTVRGFPFAYWEPPSIVWLHKYFYSVSQIAFTLTFIASDPIVHFRCMFVLQMTAFVMTLCRKGIIDSGGFHMLYTLMLCWLWWSMYNVQKVAPFGVFALGVVRFYVGHYFRGHPLRWKYSFWVSVFCLILLGSYLRTANVLNVLK